MYLSLSVILVIPRHYTGLTCLAHSRLRDIVTIALLLNSLVEAPLMQTEIRTMWRKHFIMILRWLSPWNLSKTDELIIIITSVL